ncbi:unnamed protein product [Phytophthora lilii]|uniref:Unnamed protein product n=1 Tax=Phytophthora lilii TaxID=2077276 RepID=A0A9W6TR20_9STRA|nr:unnamed protein product [Phytophthora lilii]
MASSFLCPPTSYSLSDNVIGGVVQRVGPLHDRFRFENDHDSREVARYTQARRMVSEESDPFRLSTEQVPQSFIGRKRLPELESLAHTATKRPTLTASQSKPKERVMKVPASRRERCRISQARYRKRQREHEEKLDEGIRQVQEEIEELEAKRQSIIRCAPTNESVWVVATEYFRLFRNGYLAPMVVPIQPAPPSIGDDSSNTQKTRTAKHTNVQLEFLQSTMSPDVTDGTACGAEALLENWRLLSLYFDDVKLQLKRLEQVGEDTLIAVTSISATITENTLRQVFPHLVDEEGELSSLGSKLLNQRLVMRGSLRFDWDASTGRVQRAESRVNALTPVLKLLGNLENVAAVFKKSLMTLEGRFVATQDTSEAPARSS